MLNILTEIQNLQFSFSQDGGNIEVTCIWTLLNCTF